MMETREIHTGGVYRVRFKVGGPKDFHFEESPAFIEESDGKNSWIVTRLDSDARVRISSDQILAPEGERHGRRAMAMAS